MPAAGGVDSMGRQSEAVVGNSSQQMTAHYTYTMQSVGTGVE